MVMDHRLELMILEVLSNLSDSVILIPGRGKDSAELCWCFSQITYSPGTGMIFFNVTVSH